MEGPGQTASPVRSVIEAVAIAEKNHHNLCSEVEQSKRRAL